MGEFTSGGYESIRQFVMSEWDYVEIYDSTGAAVTRIQISADARCTWTDDDGDNIIQVEVDITGADADIEYPVTLKNSALWDDTSANGGTRVTLKEQFAEATINQDGDNVLITHSLNIPQ